MPGRIPSEHCNHSKGGVCPKCILQETFNLSSSASCPAIKISTPSPTKHISREHSEASTSSPSLDGVSKKLNGSIKQNAHNGSTSSLSLLDALDNQMSDKDLQSIVQNSPIELEFVNSLIGIGDRLKEIQSDYERSRRLICELYLLNFKLPARAWLPLYSDKTPHLVARIPYTEGCVLNSKDRAPYCIYAEVIEVDNIDTAHLPDKNGEARLKRRKEPGLAQTADDPSASVMSEPWEKKEARIRKSSPYGNLPGWRLFPVIIKTGDDLRQELLAYQLLTTLQSIWQEENLQLPLRPYKIVVCSHNSGMIEPILNAPSLHQIKKTLVSKPSLDDAGNPYPPTLLSHFLINYGSRLSQGFQTAQQNFIRSCAAYSLACYFLQVKDRHNGNILLDSNGYLIHIDFGFIFTISPRNLGFETSPFKLTQELIDVMGGLNSESFAYFRELVFAGMIAARKHYKRIMDLVDVRSNSSLPCFRGGTSAIRLLLERFHLNAPDEQLRNITNSLIDQSRDSLTTRLYDNFQYFANGIF